MHEISRTHKGKLLAERALHGTAHPAVVRSDVAAELAAAASTAAPTAKLDLDLDRSRQRRDGARWRSHSRNGGGIMTDVFDMSTPVTRGELRDELAHLENRIDDKLGHLERKFDDKLDHLERRFDDKLDLWGGALLARITESEKRVVSELARHTQAVFESMTKQISVVDEKYSDLPGRAARLEVEVDALKHR